MKKTTMPAWKRIILTKKDWPANLKLPLKHRVPPSAESICGGHDEGQTWEWELWRSSTGDSYYLHVCLGRRWREYDRRFAARLTPQEALQLVRTSWMPLIIEADARRQRRNVKVNR
jgi:hypothetical protein